MKTIDVTMVRVYIMESDHLLETIANHLKNTLKIRGLSVFRAISGYGETGSHSASWLDLSLNLPLIIEFFDNKVKVESALEYLSKLIKHEHIVFWEAKVND
jgi:PII-like signaling protein